MAEYAQDSVTVQYAATNALTSPDVNRTLTQTHASPTKNLQRKFTAATGGTSISLADFTTIESLYVQNLDATNYVDFTYATAAATTQTQRLLAGQWCKINSMTVATAVAFTAHTAAVIVQLIGVGT